MNSTELMITDWQKELLKETFNLGVGRASATIGEMAGCEVELTVPDVMVLKLSDLIDAITTEEGDSISCVYQEYSGPFEGTALMVYSEEASLELVRLLLGSDAPIEQLTEMESDALCEVGNIVLNACLAAIGNSVSAEIETCLPEILTGSPERVLTLGSKLEGDKLVVFLKMGFQVATGNLKGYLSFLLESDRIQTLVQQIENAFNKTVNG